MNWRATRTARPISRREKFLIFTTFQNIKKMTMKTDNEILTDRLKPRKIVISIAEALAWRGGGDWLYQEKMDGIFCVVDVGRWRIAAERMKSGGVHGFDCLAVDGMDIRREHLRARLIELCAAIACHPGDIRPVPTGHGGEFVEAVLARGGEGVVAKRLDQAYGFMVAAKRTQVYHCRVVGLDAGTGSVVLADRDSGEARGRLAMRGRFDSASVGQVLKLEAFGLTKKGMLREARITD